RNIQVEDVVNTVAFEADLQRFAVETPPFAHRAGYPNVGKEVHLQPIGPVALTRFTTSARFVEAEPAGTVAADLGLRQLGKQRADLVEHLYVSAGVRTGRPTD